MNTDQTFTASQLAAALGLPKRFVKRQLRKLPAAGTKTIPARKIPAWSLDQLPSEWLDKLTARAAAAGAPSPQYMMTEGTSPPPEGLKVTRIVFSEAEARAFWQAYQEMLAGMAKTNRLAASLAMIAANPPSADGGNFEYGTQARLEMDTRRGQKQFQHRVDLTFFIRLSPRLRNLDSRENE